MSLPRVGLVVNPAANKGAGARIGRTVAAALRSVAEVEVLVGTSAAQSLTLIRRAAEDCAAVLVCGGDGIVHLAVNALAGTAVPLGIVPAGSGNDTALSLGIPADPATAALALVDALGAGSISRIDLGLIPDGPALLPDAPGRWWVSILYGGFDSAVNERANALRWPRGRRRYDVAIVAELLGLAPVPVRLDLDGRSLARPVTLVAIGNGPQYAGGKRIAPPARMDDGLFDLTVVGPVSRRTLARLAPKLPRAGHIGHPAVAQYRAGTVTFEGPGIVAYADGERIGPLPLTTRCVPGALSVLVPAGGIPSGLTVRPGAARDPA